MRKIIALLLTLMLIVAVAVPVYAVTPTLKIPDLPDVSNIKIEVNLDESVEKGIKNHVDKWFAEHPIRIKIDFSSIKIPLRLN